MGMPRVFHSHDEFPHERPDLRLGVFAGIDRTDNFERHSALRAIAWSVRDDFRVHRASPLAGFGKGRGGRCVVGAAMAATGVGVLGFHEFDGWLATRGTKEVVSGKNIIQW
jgi:hypothetical protein